MHTIKKKCLTLLFAIAAGLMVGAFASGAQAQHYQFETDDGAFAFSASAGVLALEGREIVYNGSGSTDKLSYLIWQSLSPMASASAVARLDDGWTIKAEGRVAASGIGYMEDYDWLTPYRPGFGPDEWTHRSQHPDTRLDWYVDGSLAVGQDFDMGPGMKVNLNGGFAYTDVQWAADNGTFVYSVGGFRDTSGSFSGPGITYRQQLPSVFVGLDSQFQHGKLRFDVGARAGVTILAKATDWHWARTPPLRFEELFTPAPTIGANAKAALEVSENFELFIDGRFDGMFFGRSDTNTFNNNTGAPLGTFLDASGAELLSGSVAGGVTGKF